VRAGGRVTTAGFPPRPVPNPGWKAGAPNAGSAVRVMGRGARGTRWRRQYCETIIAAPWPAIPDAFGVDTTPATGLPSTRTPNGADASASPLSLTTRPMRPSAGFLSTPEEGAPRLRVTKWPGRRRSFGAGSGSGAGMRGDSDADVIPVVFADFSHLTAMTSLTPRPPPTLTTTPRSPGCSERPPNTWDCSLFAETVTRSPTAKRVDDAPLLSPRPSHVGVLAQHWGHFSQAVQPRPRSPHPHGSPGLSSPLRDGHACPSAGATV